ncbi:MAG: aspartate 1-decarboxylase [Candidatus Omnitrophica bacterium]|nr:aspartate 1-decarboxylase [Candidatus Omnitrophota bacterium]
MLLDICKAKISNAVITATELHYEGSITIDSQIIDAAGILPFEKVQIVNLNNGNRLETYVILGASGSGEVCLNGPAARQGYVGDRIHIISYAFMDPQEAKNFKPKLIKLDEHNHIKN